MQDGALLLRTVGLAEGMAEGPAQIEHTRRPDQLGQFFDQPERDGGHATRLDLARQQSHGPRADRSGGDKQNEIDAVPGEQCADLASRPLQGQRVLRETEGVVLVGDATDDPFGLQFAQAL